MIYHSVVYTTLLSISIMQLQNLLHILMT